MKKAPFILLFLTASLALAAGQVHEPVVAGAFYPEDPAQLRAMVEGFLDKAALPAEPNGDIVAYIAPHAGYVYSGPTAAHVYKLLKQHPVDVVVIIGPWHRGFMDGGASVWTGGNWRTPLGEVEVDQEICQKIAASNPKFAYSLDAYAKEHSIEAQLPFIQTVLPKAKIVPILFSNPAPGMADMLARAIRQSVAGKKVALIASSDMSHYFPEDTAHRLDRHTFEFLKHEDSQGLLQAHENHSSEMCGHAAVQVALAYARLQGETTFQVLDYTTSADTGGANNPDRVVGYGASVIWAGKRVVADASQPLNDAEQKKLLKLARATVEANIQGKSLPGIETEDAAFKEQRSVFVTLKKGETLRGCIGRILAEEPLIDAVRHMAVEASTKDPRFPAVKPEELKDIHYEVSVLSPPMRVGSADEIVMGKHGVLVRQGKQSGVFLPKVAEHFKNDKEKFLDEVCAQKAHLPVDCWQDPATEMDVFTAQEFSE